MSEPDPLPIPKTCPNCQADHGGRRGVHWHSLTIWCLNCGWARNRWAKDRT